MAVHYTNSSGGFLGVAENGQVDGRFILLLLVWKVFKMAVCRQPVKKIQLKRKDVLTAEGCIIELGALNARKSLS